MSTTTAARPARPQKGATRAGLIGLIGCPNAGKSTLLNQLLGEKLAIASPRPQTTRNRILGVKNRPAGGDLPAAQLVLVDTPGLHRPGGRGRSRLNQFMVREALSVLGEVNVVVAILEAPVAKPKRPTPGRKPTRKPAAPPFRVDPSFTYVLEEVQRAGKPAILAVNKVDLLHDKRQLLPLLTGYAAAHAWAAIVPISAQLGSGVERLEEEIVRALPAGDALFPEEMVTDRAERFLVAELVREQVFLLTKQEVPYATCVTIDDWKERQAKGGDERSGVQIHATVHVEKEAQKRILVGEGGRMVREIGSRARVQIEALLGCPIHLALFIRVDAGWTGSPRLLKELGYE